MADNLAGFLCKLYRNTGTNASPTWSLISAVRDLDVPQSRSEINMSDRGSKYEKFDVGQITAGITFELTYRNGDTDHAALRAAFEAEAGTAIEYAAMDGAIATSGKQGLRAFCKVTQFDHAQPLADGVKVSVTLKPCFHDESGVVDPSWYTVA